MSSLDKILKEQIDKYVLIAFNGGENSYEGILREVTKEYILIEGLANHYIPLQNQIISRITTRAK